MFHLKAPSGPERSISPTSSLTPVSLFPPFPSLYLPQRLTQPLQRAVAVDLRFHVCIVGQWQLSQVVEGVRKRRVAAVVSQDAAAAASRTFAATRNQGGPGSELGGVVHAGSTLLRERKTERGGKRKEEIDGEVRRR